MNPVGQETKAPNSYVQTNHFESEAQYAGHGAEDSGYGHRADEVKMSVLGFAVALTLGFSVVELVGGFWSNSLALIGDDGPMVADSASLLFALIANIVARRGVDNDHSFGHNRNEVLAAFVNGIAMLGVVLSDGGYSFLFFWELMTVASFLLILFDAERREVRRGALSYLILMHIVFVLLVV